MSPYNQVLSNPGGWGGSYLGSYVTGNAIANFRPYLYNTNSRVAITPDGPIILEPGESYVINGRPVSYQIGRQGQTGYQARSTSKPSGARGSSSGQGGHSVTSIGTKVVSRGLSNRTMRDVQIGGSGTRGSINFETVPYRYVSGVALPFGNWHTPLVVPDEGYRYEQYTNPDDAFIEWYKKQPEGTVQEYVGDEYHPKGQYTIQRINPDPQRTVRRVGNEEGYVARDSTTIIPQRLTEEINRLQGAVDPRAVILPVKLNGF